MHQDNDTNSVQVLELEEGKKEWREGPSMNQRRGCFAAVVCNGALYAIGGYNGTTVSDSMERMDARDLLYASASNVSSQWKTLDCRLSTKRWGHAAAVVQERFIVVVGGANGSDFLFSVDIIDVSSESQYSVIAGPSLNIARRSFGMAVIGRSVFVVGGKGKMFNNFLDSVEYLELDDLLLEDISETATSIFPSTKSWTIRRDFVLDTPCIQHTVVKVGPCLVVAGGVTSSYDQLASVQVMDTERNVVWKLPDVTSTRNYGSMVYLSRGIVMIGGKEHHSCETLSVMDNNTRLFAPLLAFGKVPESLKA